MMMSEGKPWSPLELVLPDHPVWAQSGVTRHGRQTRTRRTTGRLQTRTASPMTYRFVPFRRWLRTNLTALDQMYASLDRHAQALSPDSRPSSPEAEAPIDLASQADSDVRSNTGSPESAPPSDRTVA